MIQRIQSLFLLCTAIVTGLLFFMPVASIVVPNNFTYAFYTTKVVQAGSPCVFITWNWMSLILNALITTLAVVTIFIHHKKIQDGETDSISAIASLYCQYCASIGVNRPDVATSAST